MLTTLGEIRNDVIVKMGISTSSAYYTDAIINDWIQQAHRWATSYRKWPFTEGKASTTYTTANETWDFEGYKADSIRIAKIGTHLLDKINFEDYLIIQDKESSNTDKVYSDFGRLLYVNPNIDVSGTLTVFGQYTPVDIDVTDEDATTVFSNHDEEGNEAIVEEVLSYAKTREQEASAVQFHHERAEAILDSVFGAVEDEQFDYKTHRARGGMWKHLDVLEGDYQDNLFKRNQF